jgi:hypothetical protein
MTFYRRPWSLILFVVVMQAAIEFNEVNAQTQRPSDKKGFCVVVRDDGVWRDRIEALNARWFYSWGLKKPAQMPANVDFTPMVWGRPGKNAPQKLELLKAAGERGDIHHLLGFNEPDQSSQSNISVDEALEIWPELMETNLPLGSPGCVHPDRQWMKDFMSGVKARDLRVDFVCVHSYGPPDANGLVNRLRRVHEMFGRPIWITEFAVGDWQAKDVTENKHSPEKIAKFMRVLLPKLEELDFVHRYAWFSAGPKSKALGTSALFNEDGSLTELGRIYSTF